MIQLELVLFKNNNSQPCESPLSANTELDLCKSLPLSAVPKFSVFWKSHCGGGSKLDLKNHLVLKFNPNRGVSAVWRFICLSAGITMHLSEGVWLDFLWNQWYIHHIVIAIGRLGNWVTKGHWNNYPRAYVYLVVRVRSEPRSDLETHPVFKNTSGDSNQSVIDYSTPGILPLPWFHFSSTFLLLHFFLIFKNLY